MMTEAFEAKTESDWKRFIKKHWAIFAVFIAAAIAAFAGGVYVFVWFVGNAQTTGLVPAVLSMWTMNSVLLFILHAIFWELLLVGIPVGIGAIIGYVWWRRLPQQEKQEYHLSGPKRSHSKNAGGAISPLLFIAFAIKVYIDGYWNVAISTFTLDYVIGSMVTILLWIIAIFAIPAVIVAVWWFTKKDR